MGIDEQNMKSEQEALLLNYFMSDTESSCGSMFYNYSIFICLALCFAIVLWSTVIYSSG